MLLQVLLVLFNFHYAPFFCHLYHSHRQLFFCFRLCHALYSYATKFADLQLCLELLYQIALVNRFEFR